MRDRWTAPILHRYFVVFVVTAVLCSGAGRAWSGPCTDQIAAFERQVGASSSSQTAGPTFSQTLGAQLHHQPTARDVEHAQNVASDDVNAALDQAKKADAAGNADQCNAALAKARRLFGLD